MGVGGFKMSCGTCGSKLCRCHVRSGRVSGGEFNTAIDKAVAIVRGSTGGPFRRTVVGPRVTAPDPDPFRFMVLKSFSEGGFTLAEILYHGCTNYEGKKVLLFRKDIGSLVTLDSLDPHFLEDDANGLLARFVPTAEGWELGLRALKSLL